MRRRILIAALGVATITTLGLTGCTPPSSAPGSLTLVTHDAFSLNEGTLEAFTDETGIAVEVVTTSGAGDLANQLVLTADAPLGDVVYGIDDSFASRVVASGALESYVSPAAAAGSPELLLPAGSGADELTPIDFGDVCWNADLAWFADHGLPVPTTLDDLIDPAYSGLAVTPSAASSSPGFAFLLTTIAEYGEDGWQEYWRALVANGLTLAASWSDAYYAEFSAPGSDGDHPLVLSYATSPAASIDEETGEAATAALLDTCFRQIEYAGVLSGTAQPEAAQQLVDFLYSVPVQEDIPWNMFMYPANPDANLPTEFAEHAAQATAPARLDPALIDENRQSWLTAWAQLVEG